MAQRVLAALLLALTAGASAAAVGPSNFPTGCGMLAVAGPSDTCASTAATAQTTAAQLQALDPSLDCSKPLAAGALVCVSNILGYCANKVAVEDGGTCEEVSSVAKLTVNQLLGMNPQLSDSDCDDLPAGDVCVPAPTSGTACGGLTYTSVAGDTCDSIAQKYTMSCAGVNALNPKAFNANGSAVLGQTLCIGCPPQPTCGLDVTPALSEVLNANLNICAIFRTCKAGFSMDSSQGLPSLLMPLQQPGSLRVTPAVFSDGTALVQFVNVPAALLSLDLSSLLTGGGTSVGVTGLNVNLLNGKPLLSGNLLGIFGRRLLATRQLLANNWQPRYYPPTGYMRTPRMYYY